MFICIIYVISIYILFCFIFRLWVQKFNIFDVKIYGIEADYKYHFTERNKGLSLSASASLVKGRDDTNDENLDSVNPFTAITSLNYIFPNNKFSTNLTTTYVGVPNPSKSYNDIPLL